MQSKAGKAIKIIKPALLASAILSTFANADVDLETFSDVKPLNSRGINLLKAEDIGDIYGIKAMISTSKGQKLTDIFLSKDKQTLVFGKAVNAETGKPIQIDYDISHLKDKAAFTYGNGDKEVIVFTDPQCPYCKRFDRTMEDLKDEVTFHVFLLPLPMHEEAKPMSRAILAQESDERHSKLSSIFNGGDYKDVKNNVKVNNMLAEQEEVASKLGVRGTPSVYAMSGHKLDWSKLEEQLNISRPIDVSAIDQLIESDMNLSYGDSTNPPVYIFTDTQCPYCQRAYKNGGIDKLAKKYHVNILFMPLDFHEQALEQTAYIFSQDSRQKKREAFDRFMRGGELSKQEIEKIDSEALSRAKKSKSAAADLGIKGTPSYFNENGEKFRPQR